MNNKLYHIFSHWSSYTFATGSLVYGLILYFNPSLFFSNEAYKLLSDGLGIIGNYGFAFLFFAFGFAKLLATTFKWQKLRKITLYSLLTLWMILSLSFFIQWVMYGSTNAGWWFALIIFAFGLNVIVSGKVDRWKIQQF